MINSFGDQNEEIVKMEKNIRNKKRLQVAYQHTVFNQMNSALKYNQIRYENNI